MGNRDFSDTVKLEALKTNLKSNNGFITKDEINKAVKKYFAGKQRIIGSRKEFFETFPFSPSTIEKRYGTFSAFCKEHNIQALKCRKSKYTKREIDDIISKWIKDGNKIPIAKDLTRLGLPSISVTLRFYENWKEPFYFYEKIYEEAKRN